MERRRSVLMERNRREIRQEVYHPPLPPLVEMLFPIVEQVPSHQSNYVYYLLRSGGRGNLVNRNYRGKPALVRRCGAQVLWIIKKPSSQTFDALKLVSMRCIFHGGQTRPAAFRMQRTCQSLASLFTGSVCWQFSNWWKLGRAPDNACFLIGLCIVYCSNIPEGKSNICTTYSCTIHPRA